MKRETTKKLTSTLIATAVIFASLAVQAADQPGDSPPATKVSPPEELGDTYRLVVETPDDDINGGTELAVGAFWKGARKKAGVLVPTVSGEIAYPFWVHPYDNYWMNRVSSYLFPRESVEWPIRLFAVYQTPAGEIGGGVYHIPEHDWWKQWEQAGGPTKWQPMFARPIADHIADLAKDPQKIHYGIYVRDHLFVLQVYDQWQAQGYLPFLIEMYGPCRRALKYLEKYRDLDGNGLIETTCVLSDLVVAGDEDSNSTERAEDQVMLYGALRAFSEMARQLGGAEDAAWAENWAARVKEGTNQVFWRPEGRYMFGARRVDKQPRLEYVTTTYADGYAILFGLADDAQTSAILDFMKKQSFVVPGPYHIPPVREEDKPQNPPGVYCNGGCGWGRGVMPSVALACYGHGRPDQAFDYLKRQGAAARRAGSFHEYWTWEQYAGKTEPGGAPWYCETSAGFLDVLLHGLFGLSSPLPGFHTVKVAPQFPPDWTHASLQMHLPSGSRLDLCYQKNDEERTLRILAEPPISVEVMLEWPGADEPIISGPGLTEPCCARAASGWQCSGKLAGKGALQLAPRRN